MCLDYRRPLLRRYFRPIYRTHLPEAAHQGLIGLIENGDTISINIHERELTLDVDEEVLKRRRAAQEQRESPWTPVSRNRPITKALRAYAAMATSADRGAVRVVDGYVN